MKSRITGRLGRTDFPGRFLAQDPEVGAPRDNELNIIVIERKGLHCTEARLRDIRLRTGDIMLRTNTGIPVIQNLLAITFSLR